MKHEEELVCGIVYTPMTTDMTREALLLKMNDLQRALYRLWNCCRSHGVFKDTGVMQHAYDTLKCKDDTYVNVANMLIRSAIPFNNVK